MTPAAFGSPPLDFSQASIAHDAITKFDVDASLCGYTTAKEAADPMVLYRPREYAILDSYSIASEIYNVRLSPTLVSLAYHKETNQVSNANLKSKRDAQYVGR